ncbi:MAG: hypothetical protein PVJ92_02670 [Candidatus Dependentiae bacterium]
MKNINFYFFLLGMFPVVFAGNGSSKPSSDEGGSPISSEDRFARTAHPVARAAEGGGQARSRNGGGGGRVSGEVARSPASRVLRFVTDSAAEGAPSWLTSMVPPGMLRGTSVDPDVPPRARVSLRSPVQRKPILQYSEDDLRREAAEWEADKMDNICSNLGICDPDDPGNKDLPAETLYQYGVRCECPGGRLLRPEIELALKFYHMASKRGHIMAKLMYAYWRSHRYNPRSNGSDCVADRPGITAWGVGQFHEIFDTGNPEAMERIVILAVERRSMLARGRSVLPGCPLAIEAITSYQGAQRAVLSEYLERCRLTELIPARERALPAPLDDAAS